jgi:hypothetical protein
VLDTIKRDGLHRSQELQDNKTIRYPNKCHRVNALEEAEVARGAEVFVMFALGPEPPLETTAVDTICSFLRVSLLSVRKYTTDGVRARQYPLPLIMQDLNNVDRFNHTWSSPQHDLTIGDTSCRYSFVGCR